MKEIKIIASLETGWAGASTQEVLTIEVPDHYTEEEENAEIENQVMEWGMNHISIGWSRQ